MGFIQTIVESINADELHQLKDRVFVMPTRRSGVFLLNSLTSRFHDQVFIAPEILTIEEFACKVTGYKITPDLRLLFELYELNKTLEPGLKFDKFYSWGNTLLYDFNDIDKNLVNTESLYRNLSNLKEIDTQFGDVEEVKQALEEFQKMLADPGDSELIRKFQKNWRQVGELYVSFNEHLRKHRLAYSGMVYREMISLLEEDGAALPFSHVYFCGFNALNKAEERLLDLLAEADKLTAFWDADKLYLDDDRNDAGMYLRRYRRRWKSASKWIIHDMYSEPKEIEVIGTAKSTAQSKVTGQILEESKIPAERTAVVLADENLLAPILYSIPEKFQYVNVTMGYPLKFTSFYAMIRTFFELASHSGKSRNPSFKGSILIDLLENPVIQAVYPQSTLIAQQLVEDRKTWISREDFLTEVDSEIVTQLLEFPEGIHDLLEHLISVLVSLFYRLKEDDKVSKVHLEFDYHFLKHLKNLSGQIRQFHHRLDIAMLYRILHESILQARVPFVGEPVRGLQVMGFLESRLLDFEKLIIVTVNEGKLPNTHAKYTYIPFAVRRAFGMPTFDITDKMYAYHFKRLLQRAKQVHLIYDTEVAIDGSGEQSRLLLQLREELRGSQSNIIEKTYSSSLSISDEFEPITVDKTPAVMQGLDRYLAGKNGKSLGPTLLTNYIDCTLRFYFRHVARIPERQELSEEMDAREFGNVAHDAFEFLYSDSIGQWQGKEALKALKQRENIERVVDLALEKNKYIQKGQQLEGRNILNRSVIIRLVDRVLEQDIRDAPIKIVGLEEEDFTYRVPIGNDEIILGGKIDRLDMVRHGDQEVLRVIDYKTGRVQMVSSRAAKEEDPDIYLHQYFTDGRFKSGFQTYYYGLILQRHFPEQKIMSGIYSLQEVNKGVRFLRDGRPVPGQIFDGYERRVKEMIEDLYDPAVPFVETDDHKNCEYCAFRHICRSR